MAKNHNINNHCIKIQQTIKEGIIMDNNKNWKVGTKRSGVIRGKNWKLDITFKKPQAFKNGQLINNSKEG